MSGIEKILSGGQTGVDRAALDAALSAGIACGGWCPHHRWAEDGPIDARYPLEETPESDPAQRTSWNVRDADATLVLARGAPRGGSALALSLARAEDRPALAVDLEWRAEVAAVQRWIDRCGVRVLNVAGPRESEAPGVYAEALRLLTDLLNPRDCPRGGESGADPQPR